MGLSKENRIKLVIGIDVALFFVEIILGYAAHSLALVADAFHMLNDVMSLIVGLWAVRVARKESSQQYTYGWLRAEVLGGFVNGVFLIALCVSLICQAIKRLFEPQEVRKPEYVLIMGGVGLGLNLLGLLIFGHGHGHGHDHGHEHEHEHEHKHEAVDKHPSADLSGMAEAGQLPKRVRSHSYADGEASASHVGFKTPDGSPFMPSSPMLTADKGQAENDPESTQFSQSLPRGSVDSGRLSRARSRRSNHSRIYSPSRPREIRHPALYREDIKATSRAFSEIEPDDISDADDDGEDGYKDAEQTEPLLRKYSRRKDSRKKSYSSIPQSPETTMNKMSSNRSHRRSHSHSQPHSKKQKQSHAGHSHSHDDMNLRGMFLHVLGDALGNVGVMASALIIWLTTFPGRFYFDPAISLFITALILKSAWPLCRDTAKPLLQATPNHISIEGLRQAVESLKGVVNCHHIHVWALTPSNLICTLDVELNFDFQQDAYGAKRYMDLGHEIKTLLLEEYDIQHCTIQPEFHTELAHSPTSMIDTSSSTLGAVAGDGTDDDGRPIYNGNGNGKDKDKSLVSGVRKCLMESKDGCGSTTASGTVSPGSEGEGHKTDKNKHR